MRCRDRMRSYRSMRAIMRCPAPLGAGSGALRGPSRARLICRMAARAAPCAPVFAGNAAGHGLHDNQTTTGAHDAHGQPCGPSARPRGARMALWLTLAVLVGAIYLFVTERLRVDVVALL